MINNWAGLKYAWTLWIVYGAIMVVQLKCQKDILNDHITTGSVKLRYKIGMTVGMINSIALIILYPIESLLWCVIGVIAYPVYCMWKMKTMNPLLAVLGRLGEKWQKETEGRIQDLV